MPVTGRDILTDADMFRAAYPRWPSTETPDPLVGPFMTSRQITDSSDDPGYAVSWPPRGDVSEPSKTAQRMTRLLAGED
jgi:hypothetical protein